MKTKLLKPASAVMTSLALVAGVTATSHAAPVPGAVTASRPVDVVGVRGSAEIDQAHGWVSIKMSVSKARSVTSWYVNGFDVYRGGARRGTVTADDVYADTSNNTLHFRYDSSWGRGWAHVRHIRLSVYTKDGGHHSYTDGVGHAFTAKSAIRGSLKNHNIIRVTRHSRRVVHFSIGVQYYSSHGWTNLCKRLVYVQERHNGWRTIKSLRTNGHGRAWWDRHARHWFRYRIKINSTPRLQGGHSSATSPT